MLHDTRLTCMKLSPPEASWHTDYRDTAFVNFGGLPYELSEGDIITIFSQYGEPVFLKLARDKETGKSKGFGWLKYEDQRSTDLAVDNLGGAEINGRLVRVDHARYKPRDDEDPEDFKVGWEDIARREKGNRGEDPDVDMQEESSEEEEPRRPMIKEEIELAKLIEDHDEDDPMKGFLIEEKKKEVEEARRKEDERKRRKDRKDKHRHHHRSHHSRRDDKDIEERHRHRRSRRDETPAAKDMSKRSRTPAVDEAKRGRDETPPRKERTHSTDYERRRHNDERDRFGDGGRRRDYDKGDKYERHSRHDHDRGEFSKDPRNKRRNRSRSLR